MVLLERLNRLDVLLRVFPEHSSFVGATERIESAKFEYQDLIVPIYRAGKLQYQPPELNQIRGRVKEELNQLDKSNKRLVNPHQYSVGLEKSLYDLKTGLILNLRDKL